MVKVVVMAVVMVVVMASVGVDDAVRSICVDYLLTQVCGMNA